MRPVASGGQAGPPGEVQPLRVALVLSGAVALGSFEAGVVYELLRAVDQGAPMTVDLVAGSSAGALVGTLAVRSLVTGSAYGPGLERWMDVTLNLLTEHYERPHQARRRGKPLDESLLSSESVRRLVREYLVKHRPHPPFRAHHPAPRLALVMTMTNLDGLPGSDAAGAEYRYGEAVTFTFHHSQDGGLADTAIWERVALVAMASASFPGAFDPETVNWAERLQRAAVQETWENEDLLARLEHRYPGLQARFRYVDGGVIDNQPLERAVSALPQVTGGPLEAGLNGLIYDPQRCFIFVEPDPPVSALEQVVGGKPLGLFPTIGRALRIWDIASSPYVSRKRILAGNERIMHLWRFLSLLGRRFRDEHARGMDPVAGFTSSLATVLPMARVWEPDHLAEPPAAATGEDQAGEEAGLIDGPLFSRAVDAFYEWLADSERLARDLAYFERTGSTSLAGMQRPVREALTELREVYLSLGDLDPDHPNRYQGLLRDAHRTLALDLGLNRPWILLSYITPESPSLSLRGEEAVHFGGFFSPEFLRHDFAVGRFYARRWLKQTFPEHDFGEELPTPELSNEGITWSHLLDNYLPFQRIAGRILSAAGWPYAGALGRVAAVIFTAILGVSASSSVLWALAHPIRRLTGNPDLVEVLPMLAAGGALFPLALAGLILVLVPGGFYRALWQRLWQPRDRD